MNNLPVLIVGAGPTGLMMACQLARHGINFRIIDKKSEPTQASNATLIQARTLELFDQMGIVHRFIKSGHSCDAINFYVNGKQLNSLFLKHINSTYAFILLLPQSKTEKILEEYLTEFNKTVERSVELIDVQCNQGAAISTIKYSNGSMENIKSDWLIACDGANSIVREKCGFHFPGEDLAEQFMVADATIDFSYLSKDQIHFFFGPGTVLAAFPLGGNKYRLAANLHLDYPRKIFTEREVIEIVQERAQGQYYVTDVAWISPFWIHSKITEHMRKGPVFLAGDAAHIHSPALGQGMNAGIQDACNLAWKLAYVIQGKAKNSLLESYEIERYPVIQETIKQNEYLTNIAIFDKKFLSNLKNFSKKLSSDKNLKLTKKLGDQITQLDIQYKNSPIIKYEHAKNLILPGKRVPEVLTMHKTLYHYFDNTKHNILLFTGLDPNEQELILFKSIQKKLEKHSDLLKTHVITKKTCDFLSHIVIDENNDIHNYFGITKPTIIIARPDTYVAFYSQDLTPDSIDTFLQTYLKF